MILKKLFDFLNIVQYHMNLEKTQKKILEKRFLAYLNRLYSMQGCQ